MDPDSGRREFRERAFVAIGTGLCLALVAGPVDAAPRLQLAYLDPGSGSFLIQALIASLAGAAVAVHSYWKRIKAFFSARSGEPEAAEEPPDDE